MAKSDTIRVLALASEFNSARLRLKDGFSRPSLDITETASVGEFLNRISESRPQVLVVSTDAIRSSSLGYLLEELSEEHPELPVVALGSEVEDDRDAARYLEEGASDYLPISLIQQLPRIVHRAYSDRQTAFQISSLQDEVQRAHGALLDNQKLIAIGRLAGSIAHEINNPLESITNLLYLLRTENSLSGNARSYVELAEREMGRVAQISKQTLNFYRETQTAVRVRPADLLDEVLVLYARRIGEKRISVVRQYKSDVSLSLFPGEMRQVLSNLVANAIEASPFEGRLSLRVSRARWWSDEGIEGVRIVVADNGCGIPAEIRQHLGQLFYTTKGQRGTGLGLWVTRAIVKRYGGEIQLFSSTQPHRHGTCFSIFLPMNMRPHVVVKNAGPAGFAGGPSGGGRSSGAIAITGANDFGSESVRARNRHRRNSPLAAS
jgi:two-component system NtrC family sensor kinase